MTYKHLKFTESSTMQAFEKMAKEKGLIKADPTKKVASKSLDLIPSDNLLENILKLTSGLRAQGFNKYAGELEKKFLSFKEAQSLYETSKETGEDLVDQAHPKGSHDLEGVEGDATVETIVDQQKKIKEVVDKKPTGKFANNNEIIDAVKLVLAQTGLEGGFNYLAQQAISDSGGLASRVLSLLSGGGEAGAAGAAGVGTAASIASIALSAVIGSVVGYEIIEAKYYATSLKDAGENFISELNDVESIVGGEQAIWKQKFIGSFNAALKQATTMSVNSEEPKISDVLLLKSYINNLLNANNYAAKFASYARSKYTGSAPKPGESSKDSWFSELKTIVPFSDASALKDVEATAGNFINVATKAIATSRSLYNEIIERLQKLTESYTSSKGGGEAIKLMDSYKELINDIGVTTSVLNAKKDPKGPAIIKWLNESLMPTIVSERDEFNKEKNKEAVVKYFFDRLENEIKPKYAPVKKYVGR